MIKAIIFDCFGVLVMEAWTPFRDEHFGTSGQKFNRANQLMGEHVTGRLPTRDFEQKIGEMAEVESREVHKALHDNPPNEELLEYIAELRPQYKIAILSNVGSNRLESLLPERLALFDVKALSVEIGAAKPDEEAYLKTAELLGIACDECIFVDDQEKYCVGARDVGMQALRYDSFADFRYEIETLLR